MDRRFIYIVGEDHRVIHTALESSSVVAQYMPTKCSYCSPNTPNIFLLKLKPSCRSGMIGMFYELCTRSPWWFQSRLHEMTFKQLICIKVIASALNLNIDYPLANAIMDATAEYAVYDKNLVECINSTTQYLTDFNKKYGKEAK